MVCTFTLSFIHPQHKHLLNIHCEPESELSIASKQHGDVPKQAKLNDPLVSHPSIHSLIT